MKKFNFLIFLFFLLFTTSLRAQTLDVNFTGSCGSYIGFDEDKKLAQSFTAGISGALKSVKVGVSTDACTETTVMNCIATIYQGDCQGTVLTTQVVAFPTNSPLSMKEISFTDPATLIAGQMYTLEISVLPNQNCSEDPMDGYERVGGKWHLESALDCGGSYAGGTAYLSGCVAANWDNYIQTYVTATLGSNENDQNKSAVNFFPNPSSDFVQVSGLKKNEIFEIYTVSGDKLISGQVSNGEKIDIKKLVPGVYLLKFKNGKTTKLIKK